MPLRIGDPLVDQMAATINECHATVEGWAQDQAIPTTHEVRMVDCMTALSLLVFQLAERLNNEAAH